MRIIVNAISARMGGIVTYTSNLIDSFTRRGIDAQFVVSDQCPIPDQPSMLRLPVHNYFPAARLLWEQTVWRRMVHRKKPDVLFSSANFGLLTSPVPQLLLVREGGLFDPYYLANCTPEQGVKINIHRSLRRKLIIASARRAELVMTPTETMRDLLLGWAPDLAGDKMVVNPYGTMSARFTPEEAAPREWREDGVLRLLYVSVYYPHKRPGMVSRAAESLVARGTPAHATITMNLDEVSEVIGGSLDRLQLGRAATAGHVTLGRHPYGELPDLYRKHDVFVFPSVSETFGHPMAEALSSGLPTVVADTPINREICGDAVLYFTPDSLPSLMECLDRLDTQPDLRRELAQRGRKRVLASFTWEQHVDRLVDLLGELSRRGR